MTSRLPSLVLTAAVLAASPACRADRVDAAAPDVEAPTLSGASLDHWAAARRQLDAHGESNSGPSAARLRELARRVDPDDAWRNAARDLLSRETPDLTELARLADDIDWETLPPTSMAATRVQATSRAMALKPATPASSPPCRPTARGASMSSTPDRVTSTIASTTVWSSAPR